MAYGTLNILGSTSYRTSGINNIYNTQTYRQSSSSGAYASSNASLLSFGSLYTPYGSSVSATVDVVSAVTAAQTTEPDTRTYLENIVEDVTPQLGGSLDVNQHQITGHELVLKSTGLDESTQIDSYLMPTSAQGQLGEVLTKMPGDGGSNTFQMAWQPVSGDGLDYATFDINAEGELVVSYLGEEVAGAFTINANGHLEVTT